MKYISMDELAGNALIALIEHKNCRVLPFRNMTNYGYAVAKLMGDNVAVLINRDYKDQFLSGWQDYFEPTNIGSENDGIKLKDDKDADRLRDKFCGYIPLDWLMAFRNPESTRHLLE